MMNNQNVQSAANSLAGQAGRSLSRIENDVEHVKALTVSVDMTTDRIVRHARSLGYFEPPEDAKATAPTPVVTTLADALQALNRAVDRCSGALNVFD